MPPSRVSRGELTKFLRGIRNMISITYEGRVMRKVDRDAESPNNSQDSLFNQIKVVAPLVQVAMSNTTDLLKLRLASS